MTEINLRDVDQLEFLRTTFQILKSYYEQRETVLKKRKLSEPADHSLHVNKRARTEKSREEIVNDSEDERSTATNATNNTNNNNNNNADERSEVSRGPQRNTNNNTNNNTNGNQESDQLNWEFDRKAGPEDCFFFDFSSSALRQVYPSLSYDTEKEEMARQYTQIDQVIGELNVLIKNIATARALWNTNKKDFLRTLKSNPDFKNLLSNAPEDLKKAIFAEFEAEFSMFFVREGVPIPRPFLTDDMIKKLQQLHGKYIQGLVNGDILHVPFSKLETEVLQLSPVNKTTIDQVCLKLPGRTGKDILRYLDQKGNGELGSKPIIYEDKTKYLRKRFDNETTGKLARRREYGAVVSPANHKRITLKSVLKQFELIGSSNMPSDAIVDCKIDPNGTKVLVGTAHANTNSIMHLSLLYDLTQGSVRIFNDHKQTVSASMFSLDGSQIITASYDKDIIVRSATTGVVEKYLGKVEGEIFEGHENKILNVIPHYEDPNMIASFSKDTVFVWDIDIGRSKAKLPKLNVAMVVDIAFGRGRYKENLFVGTETQNHRGELQIWDLERVDKPVQVINESRGMVSSIGTSACEESQSLIVYATQDLLRIYDLRKRGQVSTLKTLQKDVNIVSFSPCERYIQSSATDNRCLVFDVRFPSHPVHIFHHEPPPGIEENAEVVGVNSTKWTHFGTFLVTGGEDSMVRIWDIAAGSPLVNALPGGNSHISSLDLSRSDDVVVCGDESGRIHLFSTKDSCYSLSDLKPIRMRAHGAAEEEEEETNNNSQNNNSQPAVLEDDVMRRNIDSYLQEHYGNNNNNSNNNNTNWSNSVNNTNRM